MSWYTSATPARRCSCHPAPTRGTWSSRAGLPGDSMGSRRSRASRTAGRCRQCPTAPGIRPPTDSDERLQLADRLAPAWLAEALRAAQPVDEVAQHTHPASVWRHYERLDRLPAGVIAFGDAIAAFNPIYGTGMTVALEQATALRTALRGGVDEETCRGASTGRRCVRCVRPGSCPTVPTWPTPRRRAGARAWARLTGRYVARVLGAAEQDPEVARRFLRVAGLLDPPSALFAPSTLVRVLRTPPLPLDLPELSSATTTAEPTRNRVVWA